MTVAHLGSLPRSHLAQVIVPLRVFSSGRAWAVATRAATATAKAKHVANRTMRASVMKKDRPADQQARLPHDARSCGVDYSPPPARKQWASGRKKAVFAGHGSWPDPGAGAVLSMSCVFLWFFLHPRTLS